MTHTINARLVDPGVTTAIVASHTSDIAKLDRISMVDVTATFASVAPSDTTFNTGTMETQTLTFPDKATAANGDYVVITAQDETTYAVALVKPVAEVQTMTVPALVISAVSKDFMILTDGSGLTWATYFDTSGSDTAPAAAAYTAVNVARKVKTDISGGTDNADIVTAMKSALNALTGFTAAITLTGTTTLIATMVVKAPCADPVIFAADGIAAATGFSGVETTAGVAAQTPTGAAWTAATHKGLADISADTTAAQVAARAETALDALTSITGKITTDDSAANGTMLLTQIVPGPVTNPVVKDFDDAGAGTITGVQTTAGVATEVDITENSVYIPAHGYTTGLKINALTTTGTLPAGVTTATPYYVIVVDEDNIQFAVDQAGAAAGTDIDLTNYGATTSVNTVDITATIAGTVKLQKNNNPPDVTAVWVDLDDLEVDNGNNSRTLSAAGNVNWALWNVGFRELRALVTITSGAVTADVRIAGKGA